MPLWKQPSPEEQLQEAEASQRALKAGGLPLQATRRLSEETAAGHPLFTSDLSTKEFSLTRTLGYQPLSQVMGSSIYYIGRQDPYLSYIREVPETSEGEVTTHTAAHQDATRFALARLEEEATLLKAHGIIGVRLTTRDYEWGSDMLEFTAIGTAIKLPDTPLPEHPFLSDLSGQEFWTLLQAGYDPVGVVTGYCAYYVRLSAVETKQLRYDWMNQEIVPFTRGIRQARSLAMSQVTKMARQLKASGVVGMHIECKRKLEEEERNRLSLWVHFSVVGTAITAQRPDHVIPPPRPTLTFTDLRPGRYGQTQGGASQIQGGGKLTPKASEV